MNFNKKQRVSVVTGAPPKRKRVREDGTIVTEKLPGIKMRRKFVSASGDPIWAILANGKSVGTMNDDGRPDQRDPDNSYGLLKWHEFMDRGMLLYSECPYGNGSLEGKKACTPVRLWTRDANGNINEDKCCKHIEEIMAVRQAQRTEHSNNMADQFKSAPERMYEAEYKRLQMLNEERATVTKETPSE